MSIDYVALAPFGGSAGTALALGGLMKIQSAAETIATAPVGAREETALMVAFQSRRDHDSFETLYQAAAPGLLLWIKRLHAQRLHKGDPRETLQDTFLNIYRYASSFKPAAPGGFRSWARTIAGNALRRTRRDRARRPILESELGERAQERGDGRLEPSAAVSLNELAASTRSGLALLLVHYATCFERLSERDQLALRMVEVEGRSYAEVGASLGTEPSNTKMVVFRARKRLQGLVNSALGTSVAGAGRDPLEHEAGTRLARVG